MCGIAGIISLDGQPVYDRELRSMCSAIVHRGPDDEGVHLSPGAGLAMRRLSIIDLAGGHQPVSNEDGSIWVVLNGEIYNYRELRQDLEGRGHVFATRSDTETIVHLYEEYGSQCVAHLRGMFGFALWDERRKTFLLARDRLGIKPVYYAQAGGRLLFASELKSILKLPDLARTLNWGAVSHLFTFLTTPPDQAIIEGVSKLEPGHMLRVVSGAAPAVEPYWNLKFQPEYGKPQSYYVERLRELLTEAVRLHMVSDVPVGAFLSGGLDSSAVVAAAAGLTPEPLKTFSIGFCEPDYNELDHARIVSAKVGTDHHELLLGPDALDQIGDLAWYLDEPFGDSSAIPTYLVSKLASQFVKVVLSGDGGDEIFAGYEKYVVERRERRNPPWPRHVRRLLATISQTMPRGMRGRNFLRHQSLAGAERYLDAITLFPRNELKSLFRPEYFELLALHDPWESKASHLEARDRNWLSNLQALDLKNYLPLDILTKVDRMSMAHSIEARVPLLDHKLVEFAATIPPELNLSGETTKYTFKQAMRGILPDSIIDRPKHGFAIPLNYWFRGKLGGYVRDLLLGEQARQRGLFNTGYLERLLARHERGQNLDLQLWTLISFELWWRTFLQASTGRAEAAA
jgi:asparagine synthase (glutamine-hydrolysing)